MEDIIIKNDPDAWINKTRGLAQFHSLDLETLSSIHYQKRKEIVKWQMKQVMAEKTNTTGSEKSKYKFSTSANSPENKHLRTTRTRVVVVDLPGRRTSQDNNDKNKNMFTDLTCRGCGHLEETQQHILEDCPKIHKNPKS